MTLGGLALAVGILVDDATVTIENINWHLEQGKEVETAIMDGARQIVTPAFVSLLCICIVFVPMFFLEGVARFLFVPMAEAVMFAMICSFILSRTLVPTMANYLLKPHAMHGHGEKPPRRAIRWSGSSAASRRASSASAPSIATCWRWRWAAAPLFIIGFMAFVLASFALAPFLGRNFFPSVDAGQILMHARAPVGTRVEETADQFAASRRRSARSSPPHEIATMVDNIGMPVSGINMAYNNTGVIGPQDGDIQIKLTEEHRPTDEYVAELRAAASRALPGRHLLLPAGRHHQPDPEFRRAVADRHAGADVRPPTGSSMPTSCWPASAPSRASPTRASSSRASAPVFAVDVDRTRAQYVGLTTRDVTNSLVVNLAGSGQVAPTYWLNPANGVSYPIVMQTPQYRLEFARLAVEPADHGAGGDLAAGAGRLGRHPPRPAATRWSRTTTCRTWSQIYAAAQGRDLGAVAADIRKVVAELAKGASPKVRAVKLQGQVKTMESAFSGLFFGLLGAIVLIYLLIVVNFQSWIDPFVIITALPAALAGIVWMLFATGTTLSVPALTGAIMCMGVATANSILVISFARERLAELGDATAAALEAGFTRFRPVLMTALAMIIGMAPMALGLGEGGEQNAPLGRAVIGGLIFATIATLIFVPVVFSVIHRNHGKSAKAAPAGDHGVANVV